MISRLVERSYFLEINYFYLNLKDEILVFKSKGSAGSEQNLKVLYTCKTLLRDTNTYVVFHNRILELFFYDIKCCKFTLGWTKNWRSFYQI